MTLMCWQHGTRHDRVKVRGGDKVSCNHISQKGTSGPACAGSPCTAQGHRALGSSWSRMRQNLGWCPVTFLPSPCTGKQWGQKDFHLKMYRTRHLWHFCPFLGGREIWKFTIYSILFRSKIFTLFYNLSQLEHIHKFFSVQTTMFGSSVPPEVSTYIGRYSTRGIHNL